MLCDGNFVHHATKGQMGDMPTLLARVLGGEVKAMATRCVLAELRKLGDAFSGTIDAARCLGMAACEHEVALSATECIKAMIGDNNPEHFFVASQDIGLRGHIRKIPGGALIYVNRTAVVLEPPSEQQEQYAKLSEAERLHLSEREAKILKARILEDRHAAARRHSNGEGELRKNNSEDGSLLGGNRRSDASGTRSGGLMDDAEGEEGKHRRVKTLAENDKPTFKRKHAKGPNPLSVKKKAKTGASASTSSNSAKEATPVKPSGRKRRRPAKKEIA